MSRLSLKLATTVWKCRAGEIPQSKSTTFVTPHITKGILSNMQRRINACIAASIKGGGLPTVQLTVTGHNNNTVTGKLLALEKCVTDDWSNDKVWISLVSLIPQHEQKQASPGSCSPPRRHKRKRES